jgi:F-type H+-transporting ATPase subunit alpha
MEAFAMFASDLDAASRAQLARGARLVELLKQRQSNPYPVEEQVVSVWAGTTGQLDSIAVEDVRRFETEFLDHLRREQPGLLAAIRETGKLEDSTRAGLETAATAFKRQFSGQGSDHLVDAGTEATPDTLPDADIEQAQIVAKR